MDFFKKTNLIFYLFFFSLSVLQSAPLEFVFISTAAPGEKEYEIIEKMMENLSAFPPLSMYAGYTKFSYQRVTHLPVELTNFDTFSIDTPRCISLIKKKSPLCRTAVFVVPSDVDKGQGGTIGNDSYPVIFITTRATPGTLRHEFIHAFSGLGDEYGGPLQFLPSEKEIAKYKNLSLKPINPGWQEIKKAAGDEQIQVFEGGLERDRRVYRPYPDCLMRSLHKPLCPVCLYYTLEKLAGLTGQKMDFKKALQINNYPGPQE